LPPTKLACAADEITSPAPSKIKVVLDRDKKGESVILESPDKNN